MGTGLAWSSAPWLQETLEIKRDDIEARFGRREQHSRWPLAGTLVVAGLAGWVVRSNETIRARLNGLTNTIGQRISTIQRPWQASREIDRNDPIAFNAAETLPPRDLRLPRRLDEGSQRLLGRPGYQQWRRSVALESAARPDL